MNTKALVAAGLLAAIPAAAAAQTLAPVSLADVQIQQNSNGSERPLPGLVTFDFVNRNRVTATEVDVVLTDAGSNVASFVEKGSYAPGVAIHEGHIVTAQSGRAAQLVVAGVKFADGTTWTNDAAPQAMRQATISLNSAGE